MELKRLKDLIHTKHLIHCLAHSFNITIQTQGKEFSFLLRRESTRPRRLSAQA